MSFDSGICLWRRSHRFDKDALPLADRHYNRQKPGTPQFVPPGRCVVLLTTDNKALWVSSWPLTEYVKHAWAGAWVCSCFRNEGGTLSSLLIREAVSVTRHIWGDPPPLGMVTFVDRGKVRSKRDFGWCYQKAGWHVCGETKGGLLALRIGPGEMSEPKAPLANAVMPPPSGSPLSFLSRSKTVLRLEVSGCRRPEGRRHSGAAAGC